MAQKKGSKKKSGGSAGGRRASGGGRHRSGRRKKKSGGGGGRRLTTIAAVVAAAVAIVLIVYFGSRSFKPVVPEEMRDLTVVVYTVDEDGLFLKGSSHRVERGTVEEEAASALKILLEDRSGTLPDGTRLIGLRVKDGTAYVDMSKAIKESHAGGSTGELITIYSIVNTLAINFKEIRDVQLLIEGRVVKTLAGHVDISVPVEPDKKIIKGWKKPGKIRT